MFAGLSESATVDTPRAFSAPPIARARALEISPRSYACSGDVDIGCAIAAGARAIAVKRPKTAGTDLRTRATLTARTYLDEFSASETRVHPNVRMKDAEPSSLDTRTEPKTRRGEMTCGGGAANCGDLAV